MSDCNCHSEVTRDGSGQLQRYLNALDPTYAPIDGRSIEDLLVFAKRYAKQIRFYDIPDSGVQEENPKKPTSTWSEFFRRDMAVIAASLAVADLEQIKKDYDETAAHLSQHPTQEVYAALYTNILGMAARLDRWYVATLPGYPLRNDLELGIASSLRPAMQQILAYEKGYPLVEGKNLKLDYSAIDNAALWGLDEEVNADTSIYAGATPEEKILHASLFAEEVFLKFYGFMAKLIDSADDYLKFALDQYPAHQPHMALFIAFLEIFRLAQNQMNGLTGRMLDFYYRDVLHLAERSSIPDRVHLVFELAKEVATYDLAKGSTLLAGKDASGKEQVYATETDAVINSAKVAELKTLFIQKRVGVKNATTGVTGKNITAFYANPVANSSDGKGAAFTVANPKWPSLGEGLPGIERPQNICEYLNAVNVLSYTPNTAEVGFAVASPQLLLQGGKRLIKIKFGGLAALSKLHASDGKAMFSISLSAEKGWLPLRQIVTTPATLDLLRKAVEGILSDGLFTTEAESEPLFFIAGGALYIYLPIAAPPVISFDKKVHIGRNYQTTLPVMQVTVDAGAVLDERAYQAKGVNNFSIEVKVGSIQKQQQQGGNDVPGAIIHDINQTNDNLQLPMDGLRKLVLQNDLGLLDAAKPFDPFTNYPAPGKSLYIGSDEIFNKNISELAVDIMNNTQSKLPVKYVPNALSDRAWVPLATLGENNVVNRTLDTEQLSYNIYNRFTGTKEVSTGDAGTTTILTAVPFDTPRTPQLHTGAWNGSQERGFIRLDLNFSGLQNGALGFDFASSAALAPLLQVKEISVSYHSRLDALEAGIDQMFHIYPFGVAEIQIPAAVPKGADGLPLNITVQVASGQLLNARNLMFPQFTYTNPSDRYTSVLTGTPYDGGTNNLQNGLHDAGDIAGNYTIEKLRTQFKDDKASLLMLEASGIAEQQGDVPNQYYAAAHNQPDNPNLKFVSQEEGLLFIGLKDALPLSTVSLLFQFADGSAKDNDNDPPQINWTYLVNNEWRPLRGEHIVSDDTFGFQTTGIVRLEIPQDATTSHSIITDGLYWFSASVTEHSDRIPQAVDVVAQAVIARFQDNSNAQSHFDSGLPAGSIAKLGVAAAAVSKVSQPFASFDGKHKEVGKEFYTHVSERLRHKGRAVTSWDYEHLVLDRFPSIYKVKCVQHTDQNCLCRTPETAVTRTIGENTHKLIEDVLRKNQGGQEASGAAAPVAVTPNPIPVTCCGPQVSPGHVLIVPIPNLKNRNDANPLQPKTSRRTLLEIEAYLKKLTSPFVHVHARNPVYEEVLVFFRVQFYAGVDNGYYLKKLNEDVVRYLTPWAFDDAVDVQFGRKVYASAIINFIEERPYVDFITDFVMNVCLHECCPPKKVVSSSGQHEGGDNTGAGANDTVKTLSQINNCGDMEALLLTSEFTGYVVATPSTARSILVSAPKHIIVPYEAPPQLSPCEQRKILKPSKKIEVEEAPQEHQPKPVAPEKEGPQPPSPPPPPPPPPAPNPTPTPAKGTVDKTKTPEKKPVRTPVKKETAKPIVKPAKDANPGKP